MTTPINFIEKVINWDDFTHRSSDLVPGLLSLYFIPLLMLLLFIFFRKQKAYENVFSFRIATTYLINSQCINLMHWIQVNVLISCWSGYLQTIFIKIHNSLKNVLVTLMSMIMIIIEVIKLLSSVLFFYKVKLKAKLNSMKGK